MRPGNCREVQVSDNNINSDRQCISTFAEKPNDWQTAAEMISAIYIALCNERLDLELKIIRHFLVHPESKTVRDAFIAVQVEARSHSLQRYLEQKIDRDDLDELLARSIPRSYGQWLNGNLHRLKEFSENRLKQMELTLRYALFERFLLNTVGNIIWEHAADLPKHHIHEELRKKSVGFYKRYKRELSQNPLVERIALTKAAVDAVDRLRFANWKGERTNGSIIYLWKYLDDGLGIQFGQEQMCLSLEWVRRVRNHLAHQSLDLTLLNERMTEADRCLTNFPVLFVQAASQRYPKACTEDPPEEGDDGTPAYVLAEEYY